MTTYDERPRHPLLPDRDRSWAVLAGSSAGVREWPQLREAEETIASLAVALAPAGPGGALHWSHTETLLGAERSSFRFSGDRFAQTPLQGLQQGVEEGPEVLDLVTLKDGIEAGYAELRYRVEDECIGGPSALTVHRGREVALGVNRAHGAAGSRAALPPNPAVVHAREGWDRGNPGAQPLGLRPSPSGRGPRPGAGPGPPGPCPWRSAGSAARPGGGRGRTRCCPRSARSGRSR